MLSMNTIMMGKSGNYLILSSRTVWVSHKNSEVDTYFSDSCNWDTYAKDGTYQTIIALLNLKS